MKSYIAMAVVAILAMYCSIVAVDVAERYVHCKSYASNTNRVVKFSGVTGCYVQHNGNWIPIEEMTKK